MTPARPARHPPMLAFQVTVPAAAEEMATALLWEQGTHGMEVRVEGAAIALVAYFPERPGLEEGLRSALGLLPGALVEQVPVPDVDWVARFREGFRPFPVGSFLIAPPWEVPADPAGRRVLIVDPGRAFGTGTHESTRLCLRALEQRAARGPLGRVLDLGTGTGLLAVAAFLLGARPVAGVDIDPDALESARLHARLNAADLRLVLGDGGRAFAPGAFDLVLANMTAPLLRERRDEIATLRAPRSALVLSGLLREDLDGIRDAYSPLGSLEVTTDGEWAAVLVSFGGPA